VRDILEQTRRGDSVEHHETVRRRKGSVPRGGFPQRLTDHVPSGAIISACKIARDITESKKSESAAEQESAQRRRIAEILDNTITTMSEVWLVADEHDERYLLSNPAATTRTRHCPRHDSTLAEPTRFPGRRSNPLSWQDGPLMRAVRGEMVANFDVVSAHVSCARTDNSKPFEKIAAYGTWSISRYHGTKEANGSCGTHRRLDALGQLTGGIATTSTYFSPSSRNIGNPWRGVADRRNSGIAR